MHSELREGNVSLVTQQIKYIRNLIGSSYTDSITERELGDTHFEQVLGNTQNLTRINSAFIRAAKNSGDVATYGNARLLCQGNYRAEAVETLGNGSVDIVLGKALAGSCKHGNF